MNARETERMLKVLDDNADPLACCWTRLDPDDLWNAQTRSWDALAYRWAAMCLQDLRDFLLSRGWALSAGRRTGRGIWYVAQNWTLSTSHTLVKGRNEAVVLVKAAILEVNK